MRVIFFLEPVIFQSNPIFLAAHFFWADCIRNATYQLDGDFAFVANFEVCQEWQHSKHGNNTELQCFPIDPFKILSSFGSSRNEYCKAIYGPGDVPNSLTNQLQQVREEFRPDLIVMTSQNCFARHAFSGVPILSIEQAPLPRFGHPLRTVFDPYGHQVGSLFETHAEKIKSLPLSDVDYDDLKCLLNDIKINVLKVDLRCAEAHAALEMIKLEGPVALLVTQPPDWVTYEGAYKAIELESLIYSWAENLPSGWIGVPTYHPGFQLNSAMESALARASKRIRFLPKHLSTGLTEAMLLSADGMITVSSTSAITSLLLGKRTVVVGRSPFNSWTIDTPCNLDKAMPLSLREAVSTLAFLTNRYIYVHDEIVNNPMPLLELMRSVVSEPDSADWFLDLSNWTIDRARALFNFSRL